METEEQLSVESMISEILSSSKESIKDNLREQLKKQIGTYLSYSLQNELSKITSEFVANEMTDELKSLLAEQKSLILEGMKDAFVKVGAEVAKSMYEKAAKNLASDSYRSGQIFKTMLDF
jgi:tRNA/tmRNA/rRNA uracil-C5-methylase (TrmA/RlmC/RlmD family)